LVVDARGRIADFMGNPDGQGALGRAGRRQLLKPAGSQRYGSRAGSPCHEGVSLWVSRSGRLRGSAFVGGIGDFRFPIFDWGGIFRILWAAGSC
jgi:hypothetical protein